MPSPGSVDVRFGRRALREESRAVGPVGRHEPHWSSPEDSIRSPGTDDRSSGPLGTRPLHHPADRARLLHRRQRSGTHRREPSAGSVSWSRRSGRGLSDLPSRRPTAGRRLPQPAQLRRVLGRRGGIGRLPRADALGTGVGSPPRSGLLDARSRARHVRQARGTSVHPLHERTLSQCWVQARCSTLAQTIALLGRFWSGASATSMCEMMRSGRGRRIGSPTTTLASREALLAAGALLPNDGLFDCRPPPARVVGDNGDARRPLQLHPRRWVGAG